MATSATEAEASSAWKSKEISAGDGGGGTPNEEGSASSENTPPGGSSTLSHGHGSASSSGTPSTTPRIHMQLTRRKRKRKKPTASAAAALSGSSSSSSSSDEDESPASAAASFSSARQHVMPDTRAGSMGPSSSSNSNTNKQQPEGWRVKLYRLNADGSWDDCGTGRIVCSYKTNMSPQHHFHTGPNSGHHEDAVLYQELGEPTLIMQSEGTTTAATANSSSSNSSKSDAHVLLRTRILLRDAYQRQGDNIITWCEPYFENHSTASPKPLQQHQGGVDLALSFQDNAGCLDIWRQITNVQSRAGEWFRARGVMLHGGGSSNHAPPQHKDGQKQPPHDQQQQHLMHAHQQQHGQRHGGGGNDYHNSAQGGEGMSDMSHAVAAAAAHRASMQRHQQQQQHQHAMFFNVAASPSEAQQQQQQQHMEHHHQHHHHHRGAVFQNSDDNSSSENAEAVAVSMAAAAAAAYGGNGNNSSNGSNSDPQQLQQQQTPKLPNPPTLSNLEEIADTIAAAQLQLRESLAMFISQQECSYLKSLLALFPSAESKGDYGALATLAACVKTVLLLNDPSIIELIVADQSIFEKVCSALEYDPDLRDKANHRWFIRERAKFRTVVKMEDEELIATIHRSFRVTYLRDTLLRPTMDEGSLSTLTSLQAFTHADLVKGVTISPSSPNGENGDSYLVQIIRLLGKEVRAISRMEWEELEKQKEPKEAPSSPDLTSSATVEQEEKQQPTSASWKQHLAPQDKSLASRKIRRRGCLSFLRELFNMVRISLQQSDKDDFYAAIVSMEVEMIPHAEEVTRQEEEKREEGQAKKKIKLEKDENAEQSEQKANSITQTDGTDNLEESFVFLLTLLGTVLSDPTADVSEKGAVLEIISAIAMHDPSHIRRHCLDLQELWKDKGTTGATCPDRPSPNGRRQVIFRCPTNDLLLSLLFLMAVDTDAGLLLQTSEIVRIILDTDLLGEHGSMGVGLGMDDNEGAHQGGVHPSMEPMNNSIGGSDTAGSDQNQFLSMFYEHYIYWLTAPFQFTILHPVRIVPDSIFSAPSSSPLLQKMLDTFKHGVPADDPFLPSVPPCAIRSSFAVELLNFCVRAHLYRMKFFLLRSRVLGNVLKVLTPTPESSVTSGDRCLKLAAIRFLRAVLSIKDEFYHRHIIQHNLFAPVFEAFRANPVGDNLVSSAIIEMCDYIHTQNIKSLIEYIVSKHLIPTTTPACSPTSTTSQQAPSLEDMATPYVNTLTVLRKAYEENVAASRQIQELRQQDENVVENGRGNSRYFPNMRPRINMSEKALEDQRKFREADEEETYFDADDDDEEENQQQQQPQPPAVLAVDEVAETELHRTPRMFSLAQAPLLSSNNKSDPELHGRQENDSDKAISGSGDSAPSTTSAAIETLAEKEKHDEDSSIS